MQIMFHVLRPFISFKIEIHTNLLELLGLLLDCPLGSKKSIDPLVISQTIYLHHKSNIVLFLAMLIYSYEIAVGFRKRH